MEAFCTFKSHCANMNENLKLFNEKTLKTCQDKLKIRVALNLKYNDVILPNQIDDVHGYHRTCYKYFTSITKKNVDQYKKMQLSANDIDQSSGPSHTDSAQSMPSPPAIMLPLAKPVPARPNTALKKSRIPRPIPARQPINIAPLLGFPLFRVAKKVMPAPLGLQRSNSI